MSEGAQEKKGGRRERGKKGGGGGKGIQRKRGSERGREEGTYRPRVMSRQIPAEKTEHLL